MTPLGPKHIIEAADAGLARVLAITDAHPAALLGDAWLGRTTSDLLSHLHAWHLLFEGWVEAERAGESVAYPAEGYSWRDIDALNESLYTFHRARPHENTRQLLVESHARVCDIVRTIPEIELTTPETQEWLGDESLGDVAHECLGAHYEWAVGILEAAGLEADS
ncbi:ClbS/DfsB family four-helix bundle protein [Demequina sp. TTPB684]|uniref:ClbS/DfsB family four-helix bundle protein n=1 Tax=unclassified Demequina TaxID=2620311 RepID=UPI001CF562E0|nr:MULTISPECIES: ClbS/DfsB family four-helix bundle protein [unclassified Demequina]MCB2412495.1 ClbS/DfsB family four-helix bundle protein [Demequina sp. TTPB684]UPU88800.1 ClbS/DfsB family four-helix bundle protein [Demequina sp. TMPB413]